MRSQYLLENVQVMQMVSKLDDLKIEGSVDAWISKKRIEMQDYLESVAVPTPILNMLYYPEYMGLKALKDSQVLELFVNHEPGSVAENYGKVLIDFYALEYFLRLGKRPALSHEGYIPKHEFDGAKNAAQVAYKSPYFRSLVNLSLDTYRKAMDEALYKRFKPFSEGAMGLDGIVAKAIIYNLKLENIRIKEKASVLKVDADKIVRDFYV